MIRITKLKTHMREFVAVDHPIIAANVEALKQQALMFDRIAIPNLKAFLSIKQAEMQELVVNLRWLLDSGIVFEPTFTTDAKIAIDEYNNNREQAVRHAKEIISVFGFSFDELIAAHRDEGKALAVNKKLQQLPERVSELSEIFDGQGLVQRVKNMATHLTRLFSIQLRELNGLDAFAILPAEVPSMEQHMSAKHEIMKIVLAALPVPDCQTSWEQIVEYRNDPDSKNKFLDLRNWMSEIARGELLPDEAEEKLEYLLSQYRRHIDIYKMKAATGALETFVNTSADVLGNLVSFQWGNAAKALFSIRQRKIELLEGELTARGSEVAYIIKARNAFS